MFTFKAEAEWLGLDRVPTRLHMEESSEKQKGDVNIQLKWSKHSNTNTISSIMFECILKENKLDLHSASVTEKQQKGINLFFFFLFRLKQALM